MADKRAIASQQVSPELTNALKKAQEPTPEEHAEQRAEVIDQLKAAGHFDRGIIGRGPDDLSDEDIRDAVDELARRTVVSETTGQDVRDVKDQDFGNLIRDAEHRAAEDTLGIKLDDLTPLGRLIVESELRDPTGTGSTHFDDLLVDARDGTNTSGFFDRGKGSGTQPAPAPGSGGSDAGSSGTQPGGSGGGADDGGDLFGGPGGAGGDAGGDDGGGSAGDAPGGFDPVLGGSDAGQDGPPPDGDGGELDPDPVGGSDGDPGGQPAPTGGGGAGPGGGGGGAGSGGGGAGSGETVDTVFQVNIGEDDVDPSSDSFGEGTDVTFFRSDDGRWFDEAGHEVTDPADVAALEAQYDEFQEAGGTDTAGTLEVSDQTFEEAVAEAGQDGDEPATDEDDQAPPDEDGEPEPEPASGSGDGSSDDGGSAGGDGAGDGAGDEAGGGVEFTPADDSAPLPEDLQAQIEADLASLRALRPQTGDGATDPGPDDDAFGAGVGGPFGQVRDLKQDLLVDPPDPDLGFGGGSGRVGGAPHSPDSGAIDPGPDDVSFGSGSGPEQDPFDRVGSGPLDPLRGSQQDGGDPAAGDPAAGDPADESSSAPLVSSAVTARADEARGAFESRFDGVPALDPDDDAGDGSVALPPSAVDSPVDTLPELEAHAIDDA